MFLRTVRIPKSTVLRYHMGSKLNKTDFQETHLKPTPQFYSQKLFPLRLEVFGFDSDDAIMEENFARIFIAIQDMGE